MINKSPIQKSHKLLAKGTSVMLTSWLATEILTSPRSKLGEEDSEDDSDGKTKTNVFGLFCLFYCPSSQRSHCCASSSPMALNVCVCFCVFVCVLPACLRYSSGDM